MARYTGPRVRISRRFGIPIFGPSKYLERRNYGPGVHGPKSRRKHTDYGLGLIEKQKLRYYYGLMESQFRGVYEKALQAAAASPASRCSRFWRRAWTTWCFTSALPTPAPPRASWFRHGHVTVNGRKVSIPSFALEGERRHRRQESTMCRASWPPRIWKSPPAARCRTGCR